MTEERPFAEVDGLTVRHIGRKAAALRDVSFRWERGERLLLLGPSGSGKSTLALCLDGVIPHSLEVHWESGAVRIEGRDTRATQMARLVASVGVMFQDPETQLVMPTVDDELAFGLENLGVDPATMRSRVVDARRALGLVGVSERIDELSGGTKQRVALAALLAMRPGALVLDEPTANLDPAGTAEVFAAVESLARDRTRSLLLIEHRLDEALPLVDRVVVLDAEGRLALAGTPDEVFVGAEAALDRLGVWVPQLRRLAALLESDALPRGADDAAALVVARWPAAAIEREPAGRAAGERLVAARDVTFAYGARTAVRDVSFELARGELVAVVGANGAGKSTLGLLLAGGLTPTRGRIERRGRVAYVFQYPEHQFVARTVADELRVTLRDGRLDAATVDRRCDELLTSIGLERLAAASPFSLSHGQKRRLSVATALAADPDVLILDEPTFGQDRGHTEALMSLLGRLRAEGRAVLVLTHDLALVADHATRVVAMAGGAVLHDGPVADLFAADRLLAATRLRRPIVAEAFRRARAARPDVPPLTGLAEARRALAHRGLAR